MKSKYYNNFLKEYGWYYNLKETKYNVSILKRNIETDVGY